MAGGPAAAWSILRVFHTDLGPGRGREAGCAAVSEAAGTAELRSALAKGQPIATEAWSLHCT